MVGYAPQALPETCCVKEIFILTRVTRDWCIYASVTDPSWSTALERHLNSTYPSKRAVDSQNFWCLSNTDGAAYLQRRAISPALRWCSSEREKKFSETTRSASLLAELSALELSAADLPTDLWSTARECFARHARWVAGIVCCKTKRCEWTMAHCSGTESSTGTQRFSLWATSVASSSISAPLTVRPPHPGPFVLRGLAKLFGSVEHRYPCVSAPRARFARTSQALERKGKEALRNDSQSLA